MSDASNIAPGLYGDFTAHEGAAATSGGYRVYLDHPLGRGEFWLFMNPSTGHAIRMRWTGHPRGASVFVGEYHLGKEPPHVENA